MFEDNGEPLTVREYAVRLAALGYDPIPLHPNQKRPVGNEWQVRAVDVADPSEWVDEHGTERGVGLRTGKGEYLLGVIDNDLFNPVAVAAMEAIERRYIGDVSPRRTGRSPKSALFFLYEHAGEPKRQVKVAEKVDNHDQKVEILTTGAQLVVHGVHPETGQPYALDRPLPPAGQLTVLSAAQLEKMLDELEAALTARGYTGVKIVPTARGARTEARDTPPPSAVAEALADVLLPRLDPAPLDYDDWLQVGMELHSAGCEHLWEGWSHKGGTNPKHVPRVAEGKLSSFKRDGGRTFLHLLRRGRGLVALDAFLSALTTLALPDAIQGIALLVETLEPTRSERGALENAVAKHFRPTRVGDLRRDVEEALVALRHAGQHHDDRAAQLVLVSPPTEPMPNGRRFLADQYSHPERALLLHQGGAFYSWNGTCWPTIDDSELRAHLYEYFEHALCASAAGHPEPFSPNRYKVADLVDALRAVTFLPIAQPSPSWLTGDGVVPADELVSCTNGLVHYTMRTLLPHTPQYYVHHSVDFAFDPEAPEPTRWKRFLHELWEDDEESVGALQELFGYLLCGDTRLQKMFLLVGPKRSGKGTIARIIRAMIGKHYVAGPTLASLGTNFGLAPLIGKPVAIISDARLPKETSIVIERLLSISGEDVLTMDRKYRESWTGQLGARIVILSNELPNLSDSSGALASRFIVLTFTQSFYGRENPALTEELITELPSIFNWALDGLERLRARGHFIQPEASQEALRALEDLGSPIAAFVGEKCKPEGWVFCSKLYEEWKMWCEKNGRHPSSVQVFGRDLRAAYPHVKLSRRNVGSQRQRVYNGIRMLEPNEDSDRDAETDDDEVPF